MIELDTTIHSVTVFVNQARVIRQAAVDLPAGEHTLVLRGLTNSLITDSVRVSGKGSAVRLLGVDVQKEDHTAPPEEQIRELETQRDHLRAEFQALDDQRTVVEKRQEWLKSFGQQSSESLARWVSRGKADLDNVNAVGNFISDQDAELYARRRELTQDMTHIEVEIAALDRRIKRLQRGDRTLRYAVYADVETATDTTLTLEITYMVNGARWKPLYDVRLDQETVSLTYMASITQQTGEDWPDVDLALSTARPALSTTIPELGAWHLREFQPPAPRAPGRARKMMASGAVADEMPQGLLEEAEEVAEDRLNDFLQQAAPAAEVATARVEQGSGASVTYHISRPVWVNADGTEHKTTVVVEEMDVTLDYVIVPKLAEEAYLRATVTNTSPTLLLPGQASIYHEEEYVGKTRVQTIAPDEEFEVQLGIDDRIRIDRELVTHDVSKPTLTQKRRIEYTYTIELTNHTGRDTHLTVIDHIPHSTHENIDVKLDSATPSPAEHTDLNLLTWELALDAGATAEIRYSFTVEHPRNMRIIGL